MKRVEPSSKPSEIRLGKLETQEDISRALRQIEIALNRLIRLQNEDT